jgi:hypothetical protein
VERYVEGEKFGARKSDLLRGVAKGRVDRLSSSSEAEVLECESSPN